MGPEGMRAGKRARRRGGHCNIRYDGSAPEQCRRVVAQRRWGVEKTKVKKTHRQLARSSDLRVQVIRLRALRRLAHCAQVPIEVASPVVQVCGNHHEDLAKNAHVTGTRTNEDGVGLGLSVLRSKQKKYGKQRMHLCNANVAWYQDGKRSRTGRASPFFHWIGFEGWQTPGHLSPSGKKLGIVTAMTVSKMARSLRADH
ncbi:hypothetical protein C8R44DRAFT_747303 [Mycena epipterygia]|nr:hypothetical protein C8R44DRAFT_747303 [Mycena epipterygia]